MKKHLLFLLTVCYGLNLLAQAPPGYYDNIDGKSKSELKTAIHHVVRNTISLGFDTFTAQFWGDVYYKRTDWYPGGYYWDMYSNEQRVVYNSTTMAREHCMPRSWWQDVSIDKYGDANSDLLNLYPSDSDANGRKSNNPLGEVAIATYNNGVVKVGKNTYGNQYTGTAFEPADEYKGDFARTYFYMVTGYEDYANRWGSEGVSMLNNETYPVFKEWAVDMLLDWHRNDPVDKKEIDRNNEVFSIQFNRNPFVDYPELVEYIWGDKTNENFAIENKATSPVLFTPTSKTALNFGTKAFISRDILVKGALLTQPIYCELIGGNATDFGLSQSEIASGLTVDGIKLAITYYPKTEGTHTATLRLSSSEFTSVDVQLTGEYSKSAPSVDPVEPAEDMDVMIFKKDGWNPASLPSNFVTNAATADVYESGKLLAFKANNRYLIVKYDEIADILQFALKPYNAWGTNDNHVLVYESTDGLSWGTEIADFDNTDVASNTYFNTPEIKLQPESRAVKIEYKKQAQNVGLTHLILTRPQAGLNIEDVLNDYANLQLAVRDGVLYISNLESSVSVQVFDLMGKSVYRNNSYTNEMPIYLNHKGLYIVRVGDRIYKVMN